ncbi:hypothetical protein D3C74_379670 [compost metagenome]
MSTIASTPSSTASAIASAMTSRPSASVLTTSIVRPLRVVRTSPSLVALPEGMLSVHARYAVTVVPTPRSLSTERAASAAPAPDMSIFMAACIAFEGLRLMPPES